jgi:hypothetical protein
MRPINSLLDWVAAYPKSGSTWVRGLLRTYLGGVVLDVADNGLMSYQAVSTHPVTELTVWQEVQIRGAALFCLSTGANNNPTLVKTHHLFGEIAGIPLFAPAFCRRVVYVVRDPRDIACSLAHHFDTDYVAAVNFMRSNSVLKDSDGYKLDHIVGTWSTHVKSWTEQEKVSTIIIRYEDLMDDPVKELSEIVVAMEWDLDEDRILTAVETNQFSVLQEQEQKVGFHEAMPHGPFYRRGIVGSWKDELDPKLVEQIEQDHEEMMKEYGYL